jgi:hypothetical protein
LAQVELVGSEFDPKAKAEAGAKEESATPAKQKGVGGRLKAAADRLRGKSEAEHTETPAPKTSKGGGAAKQRPKKQGAKGS